MALAALRVTLALQVTPALKAVAAPVVQVARVALAAVVVEDLVVPQAQVRVQAQMEILEHPVLVGHLVIRATPEMRVQTVRQGQQVMRAQVGRLAVRVTPEMQGQTVTPAMQVQTELARLLETLAIQVTPVLLEAQRLCRQFQIRMLRKTIACRYHTQLVQVLHQVHLQCRGRDSNARSSNG